MATRRLNMQPRKWKMVCGSTTKEKGGGQSRLKSTVTRLRWRVDAGSNWQESRRQQMSRCLQTTFSSRQPKDWDIFNFSGSSFSASFFLSTGTNCESSTRSSALAGFVLAGFLQFYPKPMNSVVSTLWDVRTLSHPSDLFHQTNSSLNFHPFWYASWWKSYSFKYLFLKKKLFR